MRAASARTSEEGDVLPAEDFPEGVHLDAPEGEAPGPTEGVHELQRLPHRPRQPLQLLPSLCGVAAAAAAAPRPRINTRGHGC